jgi:hypothetical protein
MSNPSLHGSITVKGRQRGKVHNENIKKSIDEKVATEEAGLPVQSAIHHIVQFQGSKINELSANELKAYQYILDHSIIPEDFLLRKEFGGLSGVTYEERILSSYRSGLFTKKSIIITDKGKLTKTTKAFEKPSATGEASQIWPTPVCTHCGVCEDHWKSDCSQFFQK